MASVKAREIFESIMSKKPRKTQELFQEGIANPVASMLREEKKLVGERLFLGEDSDGTDPDDPAGYRIPPKDWGKGEWDDEAEATQAARKMQVEEKEDFDDRPFSMDRLKRAKRNKDKDRFNKNMSSDGYDEEKSKESVGS